MSANCPKCQSAVLDTDRYCPTCGNPLSIRIADDDDFLPLPGISGQPDMRSRKRRRRTRRWYRRPLFLTLLALVVVLGAGGVAATIYVQRQFDEINTISTPPPVVSGAVFAEDSEGEIDTSPAMRALELAESGGSGEFSVEGPPAPATPMATPTTVTTSGPMPTGDGTGGINIVDLTGTPRATAVPPTPEPTAQTTFQLRDVRESEGDSLNVLLMGVDAEPGAAIDAEVRPESLSVLHLDGETGACRVLTIPKDTRAELPGYGQTRINHALALGGVPYQVLAVEQLLGTEVDHFALIDFAGIEGLVDSVGGVTVVNEEAFEADGFSFAAGEIALDGDEALAYSRSGADDAEQQDRQQQVIRALIEELSGLDVVGSAPSLLGAVKEHFRSDLGLMDLVSVASDFRSGCSAETLDAETLDAVTETHHDAVVKRELEYSVVAPEEIVARVEWLVGGDAGDATPEATP